MVNQVNLKEFDELINGDKKVVCDFFATWCGPCKMLAPVMEEVSESFADAVFVKVDVDENAELAARYGIMSIPLVAVFEKGEIKTKTLGYMSKTEAEAFLKENL
ncbi:MAG: thioredoxin [Clostridia bacterium]|nr:thioredoxin [Clostridia bacterium]